MGVLLCCIYSPATSEHKYYQLRYSDGEDVTLDEVPLKKRLEAYLEVERTLFYANLLYHLHEIEPQSGEAETTPPTTEPVQLGLLDGQKPTSGSHTTNPRGQNRIRKVAPQSGDGCYDIANANTTSSQLVSFSDSSRLYLYNWW